MPDLLDDHQKFILRFYAGGVLRDEENVQLIWKSEDPLLRFLLIELGHKEDCIDESELRSRLIKIEGEILSVITEFRRHAPMTNALNGDSLDRFEALVVKAYEFGEYSQYTRQEIADCGDGLATALVSIVGIAGCADKDTALRLLQRALDNVTVLRAAVPELYPSSEIPGFAGLDIKNGRKKSKP